MNNTINAAIMKNTTDIQIVDMLMRLLPLLNSKTKADTELSKIANKLIKLGISQIVRTYEPELASTIRKANISVEKK